MRLCILEILERVCDEKHMASQGFFVVFLTTGMYLSVINRNISVISWNFISANALSLLWVTGAGHARLRKLVIP